MSAPVSAADVSALAQAINECSMSIERGAAWARDGAETIAAAIGALTAATERKTEALRELQATHQPKRRPITPKHQWK